MKKLTVLAAVLAAILIASAVPVSATMTLTDIRPLDTSTSCLPVYLFDNHGPLFPSLYRPNHWVKVCLDACTWPQIVEVYMDKTELAKDYDVQAWSVEEIEPPVIGKDSSEAEATETFAGLFIKIVKKEAPETSETSKPASTVIKTEAAKSLPSTGTANYVYAGFASFALIVTGIFINKR